MEDNYKPNSFKKELAQFCSKTSAHGICQVASSTTKTRALFWVLLTLTAFIVSINNIVGFVNEYLTYPVKTEVDMMHEGSLLFPSVTVCNLNQFQRSRFQNDSTMKMLSVSNDSDTGHELKLRLASIFVNVN